jgi:hypothetical protein
VHDVARGRCDDVKVVEEPLRGGRRRLAAAYVLGQRKIDRAERPPVFVEAPQVQATAATRTPNDGKERGQAAGVLLEQLDAQQFD